MSRPPKKSPGVRNVLGCAEPACAPYDMPARDRDLCLCRYHYMPDKLDKFAWEIACGRNQSSLSGCTSLGLDDHVRLPTHAERQHTTQALRRNGVRVIDFRGDMPA